MWFAATLVGREFNHTDVARPSASYCWVVTMSLASVLTSDIPRFVSSVAELPCPAGLVVDVAVTSLTAFMV
ncbi:hypothetical protein [Micromonospora sp. NPDC005171]|uniref:hypothetical protein n=1 Tax=Micromonospora sp. NPDC005171 TaxID=3156866 RepID=UPI0033A95A78